MPNYFLDRRSTDAAAEVEQVRALGRELGEGDGVLIYPEGTRFTPEKRERAIEILRRRFPHLVERAEAVVDGGATLRFTLPKGAFATTLLRELMKVELAEMPEFDTEDE